MKIFIVFAAVLAIGLAQTDNVEPQPAVAATPTSTVASEPEVTSAKADSLEIQPVTASAPTETSAEETTVAPVKIESTESQPATTTAPVVNVVVTSAPTAAIDTKPVTLAAVLPAPTAFPLPQVPLLRGVYSNDRDARILRYDNDIGPDGSYSYLVETENGIFIEAQGIPRNLGGNPPIVPIVSQGAFGWTSPENKPISITYIADENGYRASGDAIPTPPPIPAAIARALEYVRKYFEKK